MKVFRRTMKVTVFSIAKINMEEGKFEISRVVEMPPFKSRGKFERELKKGLAEGERIIEISHKEVTRVVSLEDFWNMSKDINEINEEIEDEITDMD